jgi:uncharacterized protein (TIGR02145 family)
MVDICVNYVCRAKVNATDYRDFMCHNLGAANTCADPFTPTWEINGGYWQWGRLAQAAAGPTGPDAGDANDGPVSGWNATGAPSGSWTDATKTANDPCPSGYRVPTKAQWDGVIANNTPVNMGSFSDSPVNYGVGIKLGNDLMLPVAGARFNLNGFTVYRGLWGYYWSSTEDGGENAGGLGLTNTTASTGYDVRAFGTSIRCIADIPGTIGSLNCDGTTTGTFASGKSASGVSASVPYTGGDGGPHSGQTVASTGVTGLTATLSAGSFVSGSGNLLYSITGTPASGGTASFALNIGGQTCTMNIFVCGGCCAKVSPTETREFMCHNLGSANTGADPFTPTWEINGGYWQWGRLAQAAAGPTGPGAGDANAGAVSGWNTTYAPDGSWADGSKTANDPCPAGYRIPTKAQWDGVIANNTVSSLGTFSTSVTNYGAGVKFSNQLMLPAAGGRYYDLSTLYSRGLVSYYWSSTEYTTGRAWGLGFSSTVGGTNHDYRTYGTSVRCIAE